MKQTNLTRRQSGLATAGSVSSYRAASMADDDSGGAGGSEECRNVSGVTIPEGATVVRLDDGSIELADVAQDTRLIGVATDDIGDGGSGSVVFRGTVAMVNCTGSVTAGDYLETTSTPGEATSNPTRREGSFGRAESTGATPAAFLWAPPDLSEAGGGGGGGGGTAFAGAYARRSTVQSISNASSTVVSFGVEDRDTDGFYDTGDPTKMTIPTGMAGTYLVIAGGRFGGATDGEIWLRLNGTTAVPGSTRGVTADDAGDAHAATSAMVELAEGDYLEVLVYQDNGGSRNFGFGSNPEVQAFFSIGRLGT